jgi:hypothetical protein
VAFRGGTARAGKSESLRSEADNSAWEAGGGAEGNSSKKKVWHMISP